MRRAILTLLLSLCVLGANLGLTPRAAASPTFNPLGFLPDGPLHSWATQISADGKTVVGGSGSTTYTSQPPYEMAFRWTESGGMQYVGPGLACAVSGDGSVVVGQSFNQGFRWQGGTTSYLAGSNLPGWNATSVADVSDDGRITVGGILVNYQWYGVKWDPGIIVYPDPSAASFSGITVVDGQEIFSGLYKRVVGYEPALFRNGTPQPLGCVGPSAANGWYFGVALDVSRNGRVAVGYSSSPHTNGDFNEAFRWTESQGTVGLDDLPGGDYASKAWATSANGGVVVGHSHTRYTPNYRGTNDAFYWTPQGGMQKLSTVLTQGFGIDLSGWSRLDDATGVSDSGLVIAGWGTHTNGTEEAFRVKLQQQIYINWDEPITTSFKVMKRPRHLEEKVIQVPGSWPGLVLPPTLVNGMTPGEYKDEIMSKLNEIFAASGVDIDILDSRYDAKRSAALEVRFGPSILGAAGNRLLDGKAWDVAPLGLSACDRFNSRWDGQVAVFVTPGVGLETPGYTADTIAHEVGHGLGLRHVLPGAAAPTEVMDYDFVEGTAEQFTDVVSQIIEPPTATGDPKADTHNPYYHLNRYVLGEDPGTSRPGTWDLGTITIQKFEITNISHAGNLHNVTPGAGLGAADGELGCETWSNVAYFAEVDPAVDTLSFYNYADSPLSIFASSEAGDTWDIVFGTGDAENPVFTFENLADGPFDGLLFQYDSGMDAYQVVGSFSGSLAVAMTLSGGDTEPIPEPTSIVLLVAAGLAGFVWRLPRRRCGA